MNEQRKDSTKEGVKETIKGIFKSNLNENEISYRFKEDDCVAGEGFEEGSYIIRTITPDDSEWEELTRSYKIDYGVDYIKDFPVGPYYVVHVGHPQSGDDVVAHETELYKVDCEEDVKETIKSIIKPVINEDERFSREGPDPEDDVNVVRNPKGVPIGYEDEQNQSEWKDYEEGHICPKCNKPCKYRIMQFFGEKPEVYNEETGEWEDGEIPGMDFGDDAVDIEYVCEEHGRMNTSSL